MKRIALKLTVDEARVLAELAADQLFRKEFIDPKIPGYRPDTETLKLGKALVGRLQLMIDPNSAKATQQPKTNGAGS